MLLIRITVSLHFFLPLYLSLFLPPSLPPSSPPLSLSLSISSLSLSLSLPLFLTFSIKKNLHPNIQDELGYTLLHHATLNSQRETVSFLIRNGASTTIPDSSGGCVLHYYNHAPNNSLLIGSFPLHLASWKGEIEIVKLLTTQGPSRANVDQQSNSEDTALHLAAQYGYCGVVEFLLEVRARGREGREGGRERVKDVYYYQSCVLHYNNCQYCFNDYYNNYYYY